MKILGDAPGKALDVKGSRRKRKTIMTCGFLLWPMFFGALVLVASGCSSKDEAPPQVLVTPLVSYTRPAKGPNCGMRVYRTKPERPYREVALVEGWGANDQGALVLKDVRDQSCQTGADAIMIVSDTSQFHRKQVYGVTPNKLSESVTSVNESVQEGEYINKKEYVPTVGEAGHNGLYVDAVAIDFLPYNRASDPVASSTPSTR